MQKIPFKQVDVFAATRFKGSPVAVILRADELSSAQMQEIANWTNLSETTFVLPPTNAQADYQVRIFTPGGEMLFAGHPTIGTAHALLEAGMIQAKAGTLVQQCAAGLVGLDVESDETDQRRITFTLPTPTISSLDASQQQTLAEVLGGALKPASVPLRVDVGPRWLVAQLPDAEAVLTLNPDLLQMQRQDSANGDTGVVVFGEYPPGARSQIEVRAFAPAMGVNEDPVCGSGNGCVAAYLRHTGQVASIGQDYLASQGRKLGRDGILRLQIEAERIRVGGAAVTCIDGSLQC